MKVRKSKNYNQKVLEVFGSITIIIGIIFISTTIKKVKNVRGVDVLASKVSNNECLKHDDYFSTIIDDTIHSESSAKFDRYRDSIRDKKNALVKEKSKLNKLINCEEYRIIVGGEQVTKDTNTMLNLGSRIDILEKTLSDFKNLEKSSFIFKLNELPADVGLGNITYDNNDGAISINYAKGSIHNFVHEVTHANQFCIGKIAFTKYNDIPTAGDLLDEEEAYQAQYAYNPASVEQIISIADSIRITITELKDINTAWVKNIQLLDIVTPYKNLPSENININTTLNIMSRVYSKMKYDCMITFEDIQEIPEIKKRKLKKIVKKETFLYDLRNIDATINFDTIIRLKNLPGIINN